MTIYEFEILLEQLSEAESDHAEWCEEPEDENMLRHRDAAYARVERLRAQVDAELEAEKRVEP